MRSIGWRRTESDKPEDPRGMAKYSPFMKSVATSLIVCTVFGISLFGIASSAVVLGQTLDNQQSTPEPIVIWASSPLDITIAFPRPVTARVADALVGRTIAYFQAKAPAPTVGSI